MIWSLLFTHPLVRFDLAGGRLLAAAPQKRAKKFEKKLSRGVDYPIVGG